MQELRDAVIKLGGLLLRFGQTDRATFHEDGKTPESDTDHTVMLGIIACAYAEKLAPHLDRGRIAEFALVHDLVEVYAGDTATLKPMSEDDKKEKAGREHAAYERIKSEFGATLPWLHRTIEEYESLVAPEARFVKTMDKCMTSITHLLNNGARVGKEGFTRESLQALRKAQKEEALRSYAHDQPEATKLRDALVAAEQELLFKDSN